MVHQERHRRVLGSRIPNAVADIQNLESPEVGLVLPNHFFSETVNPHHSEGTLI